MALRTPDQFGARGNGVADDYAPVQAMYEACKPGDRVLFPRTKRYLYGSWCPSLHTSDVHVDFNGSLQIGATGAWPNNKIIQVGSRTTEDVLHEWEQDIGRGPLKIKSSPHHAWLMLGTDPHDPQEEHFGCHVWPYQSEVWVPKRISGTRHKMMLIDRWAERITVSNMRADYAPGKIPNCAIWAERTRDVRINGLTGRVPNGVQLVDVEDAVVRDINVEVSWLHKSSGRPLTAWGSRGVRVVGCRWVVPASHPQARSCGIFLESSCVGFRFERLERVYEAIHAPMHAVLFANGDTRDVVVTDVSLWDRSPAVQLYGNGGQSGQERPRFDLVIVKSGSASMIRHGMAAGLLDVRELVESGAVYGGVE